jgi:DNA-directed RNA polymerase specialized sigma24 family protein
VPRDVVALVSADDFVSAIRVYSDRVNDLLRRRGIPPLEAIDIIETHALALLDTVINAPETVIDLAGWWFARAIEMTSATQGAAEASDDEAASVLAGTETEARVRTALAGLRDAERTAVVLRDAYDLPPQAVGVALRRGLDAAADLTASGRLALVSAYDEQPSPSLAGHAGRTTVDVTSLSRLADGTLDSPRAAPLRRHVANCTACEEMLETLARGRRLAAGLPIIAMDDDARESMIERIAQRAYATLPSHDAVLRAVDEDHDPRPLVSPMIAVITLLLAVAMGVGIGALSRAGSNSLGPLADTPAPSLTPVVPAFSVSPSPHRSRTASPSATPTPDLTPTSIGTTPTATPITTTYNPVLALSPTAGRSGTNIEVTGTGWVPGSKVYVSYAGKPQSSARVNSAGSFTTSVVANAFLPGQRVVTATDGEHTVKATFNQQF